MERPPQRIERRGRAGRLLGMEGGGGEEEATLLHPHGA